VVKRLKGEDDRWSPESAKINITWDFTATPPYVFMMRYLGSEKNTFTIPIIIIIIIIIIIGFELLLLFCGFCLYFMTVLNGITNIYIVLYL
jgi:hypothetical protein